MAVLQINGTNDKLTKAKVSFTVDITFMTCFFYRSYFIWLKYIQFLVKMLVQIIHLNGIRE
jgi:hypothetical protein